jgi:hypothetical protein
MPDITSYLGPLEPDLATAEPADYGHWSKVPSWTADEATALSFGIEPEWAEWNNVKDWNYGCGTDYKKRRIIVGRAIAAGALSELTPPTKYVAWMKTVGISFPRELEELLMHENGPEKPFGKTERKTYDLLIYVLLNAAFPNSTPEKLVNSMQSACNFSKVKMDDDTLRDRRDKAYSAFRNSRS